MQSKPPQIVENRPHRPNLRRKLGYAFPATELEAFFVRELHYTLKWTKNCAIPFTHGLLRKSHSDLLFCRNLDLTAIVFKEFAMVKEAARFLPHRQQRLLWKWMRRSFFAKHVPATDATQGEIQTDSSDKSQDIQFIDSPAALQGIRKLFTEPQPDGVLGIAELWRQLICAQVFSLIHYSVEIQRFDDGFVVVRKLETAREQFPALGDVRFVFEPAAGDEVLEDLKRLFREKKVRPGLKQRLKDSWNSIKTKLTLKSIRRQDESEAKKGSFVQGWERLKAVVRVKRV